MQFHSTSNDVIDAVGGTRAFAQWWGCSDALASLWRDRGFPNKADLYVRMSQRLRDEHNIEASLSCWSKVPAEVA